jgi:hypothetical protein
MNENKTEYEFVLTLLGGFDDFERLQESLFAAGCDDATLSLRFGRLYLAFCRAAGSFEEAVISAIADATKGGALVYQIDDCNLVNQSEIARRAGRSRQLINQYISGKRGPGNFPAPECQITEGVPLWLWCEVSQWLWENGVINEEDVRQAQVAWMVNDTLHRTRRRRPRSSYVDEAIEKKVLRAVGSA